jgi:hypothetical protein
MHAAPTVTTSPVTFRPPSARHKHAALSRTIKGKACSSVSPQQRRDRLPYIPETAEPAQDQLNRKRLIWAAG